MQAPQLPNESIMRGHSHVISCEVGKPAPSIPQLLLARIEEHVTDAGLEAKQITKGAIRLLIHTLPEPMQAHPLVTLSRQQLVTKAIYNLLWSYTDRVLQSNITALEDNIIDSVVQTLHIEHRDGEANKLTLSNSFHHLIGPYMNQHTLQTNLFFSQVQVPPPPANNPLAPLPLDGHLIRALRQRIEQENETSISKLAGLSLKDFKDQLTGNVMTLLIIDGRNAEAVEVATRTDVDTILDPFVAQAELALYTSTDALPQEIRTLIQQAAAQNPAHNDLLVMAAQNFLASEHRLPLHQFTSQETLALIQALEQMPVVQAMYHETVGQLPGVSGVHLKSLNVLPEAQQQAHFQEHMAQFGDQVTIGLSCYSVLVEQNRRPPEQHIAQIEVCPDEVKKRLIGSNYIKSFRANSARVANKVRLSVQDTMPIVVHELGHQVEFYLPLVEWMNIQQILHDRCKTHFLIDIYGNGEETAFDAPMQGFTAIWQGANSKYGAKVYADGDTEVLSTSIQCFCTPKEAQLLIRNDPLLAATILRAIRPQDVANHLPAPLLLLLPHG
ncbi:MAG TPA: hypothetical protein VKU38_06365 [Ktedonobacteraceae bacterium]|nr:hypothetical protein [Ktedonobacteraceae bacterium]